MMSEWLWSVLFIILIVAAVGIVKIVWALAAYIECVGGPQ